MTRTAFRNDGEKDMSAVSELPRFRKVVKSQRADLKDYLGEHKVTLMWDLSQEHIRERVFKLVIDDDIEVMLDMEELEHYARAI